MKISKSIILPEWDKFEDLEQASDILHKITEAMKDHQIQNYDDAVASLRQITTGRIQSKDGKTYFDLDTGVIKGEIIFRPGSSGLDNVEEASPNDWDNAFRLANAVKGDSDFTLISGGKIITNSIAVGAFNSDVIARMFTNEDAHINIEAWMKSGAITYIDGNKIYTGSVTATQIAADTITLTELNFVPVQSTDVIAKINASIEGIRIEADNIHITGLTTFASGYDPTGKIATAGAAADVNANVTTISGGKITAGSITLSGLGTTIISGGYIKTSLLNVDYAIIVGSKPPTNADNTAANPQGYVWISGSKPPVNADYFGGVAGALAYRSNVETAQLGSTIISGGYLRTDLIKVRKIYVGMNTNQDITFENSGISFYDYGSNYLAMAKASNATLYFALGASGNVIQSSGNYLYLIAGTKTFQCRNTGVFVMPSLTTAPTPVTGAYAYKSVSPYQMMFFNGSGWEYALDGSGW